MDQILFPTLGLLVAAIVIAIAARRIGLPYTVGLVLTGIGLVLARAQVDITLTRDFIFNILLPPLLFEGALNIRWKDLRRDAVPVLSFTVLGVVISVLVVTAGMSSLLGWPIPVALVFGVLIAATDPVAVIAMFKDLRVEGRLRLLIEGESLLNDGVAAVLFSLAVAWAVSSGGEPLTLAQIVRSLAIISGGGILTGVLAGLLAIAVVGHTADHLIETAATTAAAYGSLWTAEYFHFSGVLAAVTCGLVLGNLGVRQGGERSLLSERGRDFVLAFWDFAAFLANSFVFLMLGLSLARVPFSQLGAVPIALIVGFVLGGRALSVYPVSLLFRGTKWAIPLREQHVLWWGGLRGALALALALSLPATLPFRNEIILAAFSVVAFSVLVQGFTMPWVLRQMDTAPRP